MNTALWDFRYAPKAEIFFGVCQSDGTIDLKRGLRSFAYELSVTPNYWSQTEVGISVAATDKVTHRQETLIDADWNSDHDEFSQPSQPLSARTAWH